MSLLQMSLSGAVMIFVIVVIRALAIHRLPKKAFLALWGVVLARLLIPCSLRSACSVYSLFWRFGAIAGEGVTSPAVMVPVRPVTAPSVNAAVPAATGRISPWLLVWALGALACALFFAVAYWKCRREFRASLPVDNEYVKLWRSDHRLHRSIAIRQSGRISAPLTYGVFRPVILMPKSTDWDDQDTLGYVLAHEYVHIRRFDAVTKLVMTAALCVHWFNPAVWIMYVLANRDLELSCDAAVISQFGEGKKTAYAMALIRMEETRSGLTPLCSNFSKNAIEERIIAIMKIKKTSIFSLVLALALVFGVTAAFATSAQQSTDSFVTDEDGVVSEVSKGKVVIARSFRVDENGKLTPDPDDHCNDLAFEIVDIVPGSVELNTSDVVEYSYIITEDGATELAEDNVMIVVRTEEEEQQIIAEIERGTITGYTLEAIADGETPIFAGAEGAYYSVDFVYYNNTNGASND